MSETLDKIRSRGYWRTLIRPTVYSASLLEYGRLESIVDRVAVQIRGWDFPHRSRSEQLARGANWIGQESEWAHHLDAWKFYSSGQFIIYQGNRYDWRGSDAPNGPSASPRLSVGDAVFTFTEVFELAARLATALPGSDPLSVSIGAFGLNGRVLLVDDPRRGDLFVDYRASDDFNQAFEIGRAELLADSRSLAVEAVRQLFLRFGWSADAAVLKDNQSELFR